MRLCLSTENVSHETQLESFVLPPGLTASPLQLTKHLGICLCLWGLSSTLTW